jgi:pentose-5-phosphate-3-epimerase
VQAFRAAYPDVPAQVDGGVTLPVAQKLVALGVTNLVIGSALARATNPSAALASFNDLKTPFGV